MWFTLRAAPLCKLLLQFVEKRGGADSQCDKHCARFDLALAVDLPLHLFKGEVGRGLSFCFSMGRLSGLSLLKESLLRTTTNHLVLNASGYIVGVRLLLMSHLGFRWSAHEINKMHDVLDVLFQSILFRNIY